MTRGIASRVALAAGLILALAGCDSLKKQFGYTKQPPDEFRVVSRAPLSLPPEFSLRPPQPGATRPQEGTPTQQARQAVFRAEQPTEAEAVQQAMPYDGRSLGERALLVRAGADQADPEIRQVVNRETSHINEGGGDFLETLVFWRDPEPQGEVVDASAEAQRIQENSALGRPVTEGETPSVQRKKKALFEDLF